MDESTDAVDHVLKDVGRVVVHVELGADEGQELRPGTEVIASFIIKKHLLCHPWLEQRSTIRYGKNCGPL